MSRKEVYVERATGEEIGRVLAAGYAVTTTMDVAAECSAEFEDLEDVRAMIRNYALDSGANEGC